MSHAVSKRENSELPGRKTQEQKLTKQVQDRKKELFDVIDANLSDHPTQSDQLKEIINDWADLKVKSFENRRSWVRKPNQDSDS